MNSLKYLLHYSESTQEAVKKLIESGQLGAYLITKYPEPHTITDDRALYTYALRIKNDYMRKAQPLSKAVYDGKINVINNALGTHTYARRVQGGKIKTKNEIRIGTIFKSMPEALLRMITVHELAHFKEKEHSKAFYKLCHHMEPDYHQLEFDTRLFLTHFDLYGRLY